MSKFYYLLVRPRGQDDRRQPVPHRIKKIVIQCADRIDFPSKQSVSGATRVDDLGGAAKSKRIVSPK